MIAVCIWRHSVESRGLKEKYSPKESSRQANDAGLLSLLLVELEGFAGGCTNKQRVGKRTEVAGYPTFINTFLTVHLLSRGKRQQSAKKCFLFDTEQRSALPLTFWPILLLLLGRTGQELHRGEIPKR